MSRLALTLLFGVAALVFLIILLCTDLDNTQRWLIAGLIWASTFANWAANK